MVERNWPFALTLPVFFAALKLQEEEKQIWDQVEGLKHGKLPFEGKDNTDVWLKCNLPLWAFYLAQLSALWDHMSI